MIPGLPVVRNAALAEGVMSRVPACCFLAGCLAFPAALAAEPVEHEPRKAEVVDPKDKIAQLHPGLTAAQVRDLLGQPKHVSRQILYARYLEQWTYDEPFGVRIEFDWRKGQERQILTVQPLSRRSP
jgi:hypothetical protein